MRSVPIRSPRKRMGQRHAAIVVHWQPRRRGWEPGGSRHAAHRRGVRAIRRIRRRRGSMHELERPTGARRRRRRRRRPARRGTAGGLQSGTDVGAAKRGRQRRHRSRTRFQRGRRRHGRISQRRRREIRRRGCSRGRRRWERCRCTIHDDKSIKKKKERKYKTKKLLQAYDANRYHGNIIRTEMGALN